MKECDSAADLPWRFFLLNLFYFILAVLGRNESSMGNERSAPRADLERRSTLNSGVYIVEEQEWLVSEAGVRTEDSANVEHSTAKKIFNV